MTIRNVLLVLAFALSNSTLFSQQRMHSNQKKVLLHTATLTDTLYKEIFKQDSVFFTTFNQCDTITYRQLLTSNFEFYRDQGGLHYLEEEMQSMRDMCARNTHVRRELVNVTLEVSKLGNTGALAIGMHRFYYTNASQAEHLSGTYKFINIWQKQDNVWKLSPVIS